MCADLGELIGTVQQPHLRELLERLLGEDTEAGARWREAPAAKVYHQAYRHGLLEHSLSVAQGVSAMASTFPGIDRDVAVAGALLHDIGKIEAYEQTGGAIELSDAGKLQGEIPLGYYRVRREIDAIDGFPPEIAQAVLHIVLSHHGKLEHGSPVTPCTREATLVHMIDNLGGTLGSYDRIEKSLADGAALVRLRPRAVGLGVLRRRAARRRAQRAANSGVSARHGGRRRGSLRLSWLPHGEGHRKADPSALADLVPDGGAAARSRRSRSGRTWRATRR